MINNSKDRKIYRINFNGIRLKPDMYFTAAMQKATKTTLFLTQKQCCIVWLRKCPCMYTEKIKMYTFLAFCFKFDKKPRGYRDF